MMSELVLALIHVPPGLAYSIETIGFMERRVFTPCSDLIVILMFARFYFVLRSLLHFSSWLSNYSKHCCALSGCEASILFAVRASIKKHAFKTIFINLLISSLILSYFIHLVERSYYDSEPEVPLAPELILNL